MTLTEELIFMGRDVNGLECRVTYPVGTSCKPLDAKADDEDAVACRRIVERRRHVDEDWIAVVLDNQTRAIPKSAVGLAPKERAATIAPEVPIAESDDASCATPTPQPIAQPKPATSRSLF